MTDSCLHCTICALQRLEGSQRRIEQFLTRMEIAMANEMEQLNSIKGKLADVHADVKAKLDQVRAEVSPEGQAAFDEIAAALDSFDAEIGDADGSDTPPATPGQEPSDTAAATPEPAPVVTPDNATDENGTPLDADGNPRV